MRNLRALQDQERQALEANLKQSKCLNEWKRLFVILRFDEGQSIEELARQTCLSKWTIEEYLKKYSSENKTKNDPRGGSSSKLTETEAEELEKHLTETTYLKVKGIISYVKNRFGKVYSRTGMTFWLKSRNFTFKRPEKIPGKLNPDQQKNFLEYYKRLKSSLGQREELYFVDAVHPEYQSQMVCGWIKKGEKKNFTNDSKATSITFYRSS